MQIVDQLRKIADEMPNYPQLELHRIAHEVLALHRVITSQDEAVAYWRDKANTAESRLDALQRAVSILAQSVAACEGVSLAYYMRSTKEDPDAIYLIDSDYPGSPKRLKARHMTCRRDIGR